MYMLIKIASALPSSSYKTNSRLKYFQVIDNDILQILK